METQTELITKGPGRGQIFLDVGVTVTRTAPIPVFSGPEDADYRACVLEGMAGLLAPVLADRGPDIDQVLLIVGAILGGHGFPHSRRHVLRTITQLERQKRPSGRVGRHGWITGRHGPITAARVLIGRLVPRSFSRGCRNLQYAAARFTAEEIEAARFAHAARHGKLSDIEVAGIQIFLAVRQGKIVGAALKSTVVAAERERLRRRPRPLKPRADAGEADILRLLLRIIEPLSAQFAHTEE